LKLEEAVLLGFIQGMTEWLPVSSSGHLAIIQMFLSLEVPLFFDVMLHFGTLLVVLTFFRRNIMKVLKAEQKFRYEREGKLLAKVFLGVASTALIGFVFGDVFESFFTNAFAVGAALLITGFILSASKHVKERGRELGFLQAFLIGAAQGIAIIPGISRSGFTIAVGLLLGVKREEAFNFSFMIFVPAVLGAMAKTFFKDFERIGVNGVGWLDVVIGTAVAAVVGYFSLKLLARVLMEKRLHLFAYYCWTVGTILLLIASLL